VRALADCHLGRELTVENGLQEMVDDQSTDECEVAERVLMGGGE
jgi:hypothetical protein